MKKTLFTTLALATLLVFDTMATPAIAGGFGVQLSGPGYYLDVGRPHRAHAYYGGWNGRGHGGLYSGHQRHSSRYGHGGGHVWHDTSHYDYHPGEYVRHYDHYDYVPGHYDYHQTGHVDHYHW